MEVAEQLERLAVEIGFNPLAWLDRLHRDYCWAVWPRVSAISPKAAVLEMIHVGRSSLCHSKYLYQLDYHKFS